MSNALTTPLATGPFRFCQIYTDILKKNESEGLHDKEILLIGSGELYPILDGYATHFPQIEETTWLFNGRGKITVIENNGGAVSRLQKEYSDMTPIINNLDQIATPFEMDSPPKRFFKPWKNHYSWNSAVADRQFYDAFEEQLLAFFDTRLTKAGNGELDLNVESKHYSILDPQVQQLGLFDYALFTRVLVYFNDEEKKKALQHALSLLKDRGTLYIDLRDRASVEKITRAIDADPHSPFSLSAEELPVGPHRAHHTQRQRELDGIESFSDELFAQNFFCRFNVEYTIRGRTSQMFEIYDTGPILAITKLAK